MTSTLTMAVRDSASLGAAGENSRRLTNNTSRGIAVIIKNTASTGTSPTLTVKVQEWTSGAGWTDIAGAVTAAIAGGTPATTTLVVYPGVTVAANAAVSRPVGKFFRLSYAVGGSATPTVTFSADVQLLA